jgi:hypothetical protein
VQDQIPQPLVILPAVLAEKLEQRPFVVIVRNQAEFRHWSSGPLPGVQWLQVEQLLRDPDVWAFASHGISQIPVDVILGDPASEFSDLYRLVDVCAVRDVRVSPCRARALQGSKTRNLVALADPNPTRPTHARSSRRTDRDIGILSSWDHG